MMNQKKSLKTYPPFGIDSFCAKYDISRPTYYKLRKMGKGPKELRIGTRVIITKEADDNFLQRLETENTANA